MSYFATGMDLEPSRMTEIKIRLLSEDAFEFYFSIVGVLRGKEVKVVLPEIDELLAAELVDCWENKDGGYTVTDVKFVRV